MILLKEKKERKKRNVKKPFILQQYIKFLIFIIEMGRGGANPPLPAWAGGLPSYRGIDPSKEI